MSPPPPFPVAGGPRVVRQGDAQVALAAGGGEAWNWSGLATFARYRRGLGHRVDLGGDVMSVLHDDNGIRGTMLGKIGSRIGLAQGVAVEAGVGGSTGWRKSFSQDIALSLGLNDTTTRWEFFGTARLAHSHGYRASDCCDSDTIAPPNTLFTLASIGTSYAFQPSPGTNSRTRLFAETGLGQVSPRGQPTGHTFYVGIGVILDFSRTQR